ncbi:hypothetical protein L208DRAFT_1413515 [Tricholoma matsutake]|nr:hypothetical protein L208DRAFT_1413515 [Tricholoma matsutake 945]
MEYKMPIGFYRLVNYAEWLCLAMNCLEWYQLKPSLAPTSPVATRSSCKLKSATTTHAAHIVLGHRSSACRHIHMQRFCMGIEPL